MDIPYDSDFDEPKPPPPKSVSNFFETFPPRAAFFVGLALAVGGLSAIGFIILLFILF